MEDRQSNSAYLVAAVLAALAFVASVLVALNWDNDSAPAPPVPVPHTSIDGVQVVNAGYYLDRIGIAKYRAAMPTKNLREKAPHLFGDEHDRATLLYRALVKVDPEWKPEHQQIGDCVSHGWGLAADVHLAILYDTGEVSEWERACTEAIYGGSRVEARDLPGDGARAYGGYSDGSTGFHAAKWVSEVGGVLLRHGELETYSGSRAKEWGAYGCGGKDDAGKADADARMHPIRGVSLVTDWDQLVAAIESGHPVAVCSGQGFSFTRDSDGFAKPQGVWWHCMAIVGVRHDREGALIVNSWGPSWNSGPKWPADQPDGSFWADRKTIEQMLALQDSYAVSRYEGFRKRQLRHSEGW